MAVVVEYSLAAYVHLDNEKQMLSIKLSHVFLQHVFYCSIYLILVAYRAVDKQPADCFAAVVAYLDVVEPLASVESLVLPFK